MYSICDPVYSSDVMKVSFDLKLERVFMKHYAPNMCLPI